MKKWNEFVDDILHCAVMTASTDTAN